jgi:hypothetical protein
VGEKLRARARVAQNGSYAMSCCQPTEPRHPVGWVARERTTIANRRRHEACPFAADVGRDTLFSMSLDTLTVALWGDPNPVGARLKADGARVILLSGTSAADSASFESFELADGAIRSADDAANVAGRLWEERGPVRALIVQPFLGAREASEDGSGAGDLALPESAWREALDGALKLPFFLARELATQMEKEAGGRIVAVAAAERARGASLLADVVRDALVTWTLGLAKALPRAVQVHAVIGPNGSLDGVAESAVFLLTAPALPTGTIVRLDGEP